MSYIDDIIEMGQADCGYVISRNVKERGIPTVYLTRMVDGGMLNQLTNGIYILPRYMEDEFYTCFLRYRRAVFSRRTALYLNGITNRQLECIEANFPAGYNTTKIDGIRCYRICNDLYELGQTTAVTAFGHTVPVYNIERCICDLFYYDDFDVEEKGYVIRCVDKSKIDYDKLFAYAKQMKVLPQVKSVFEVL
ncbi:MAG: hypothetical protein HFJ22_07685 [Clostridia bacterium]|nr:hypothetical protein [Clostridia bacterium]MCI9517657.1 hypothetical protein [Clostridia bacterium]